MQEKLILNSNDINNNVQDPCLPLDYNYTYIYNNISYNLYGSSNYSYCYLLATDILNINEPCSYPPCSINGNYYY